MSEQLGEGRLSAEDADRLAAEIRPAWDLDDGSLEEGGMDAAEEALLAGAAMPSSGEPTDPTPPPAHDTLIQGTPTLAVGDGAAAGDAGAPISTSRTQQVPEPARKKTMLGLGDDGEASSPIPLERKLAPPAGAPEKGPGDTLESPKLDLPTSSKSARSSKPAVVSSGTASARAGEESIELPITKTSGSMLWIGLGAAAVAAAALGYFALSGEDTKPTAPTPTATVAAAATTAAPQAPAPTSSPATSPAAPTATSTAAPAQTASPTATTTAKPAATPTAPTSTAKPPTTSKPGGGTPPAKPTSTGKPGLMRDAPF